MKRLARRLLGIGYSPSREAREATPAASLAAILQAPRLGAMPAELGAGGPTGDGDWAPPAEDDTLTDGVTPHGTHSGEQETTTMDQPTQDTAGNPIRHPRPHPSTVEAWVEDEWTRDALRVVLRGSVAGVGPVYAVPQQIDNQPVSLDLWLEPAESLDLWLEPADPEGEWVGDQPGLRLQRDNAVTLSRAILRAVGDKTPTEAELEDLTVTATTLTQELQEARQAAVVASLERDEAMAVAGAYLDQMDALRAHLVTREEWHLDTMKRLENLEAPHRLVGGHLDETTETWDLGQLHAVPQEPHPVMEPGTYAVKACPYPRGEDGACTHHLDNVCQTPVRQADTGVDWASLVNAVREGDGFTTEVGGVKIAQCDEYGRTKVERDLANRASALDQAAVSFQAARDGWEARNHRLRKELADAQAHVAALQAGIHAAAGGSPTGVDNPVEDGSGERWTTVAGDTWEKAGDTWRLVETTGDPRRLGAVLYVGSEAVTPEGLDRVATDWANRPEGD